MKDPDACYICGKKGHFSWDCRAPCGDQNQQGCYTCGKRDTLAATVLSIQVVQISIVEGMGVADFKVGAVSPEVRVEGEARVEEALVALIHP